MMRRSHLVMVVTAAGLAGLMSFHTKPTQLTLGSLPVSTTPRSTTSTTAVPTSGDDGSSKPVTTTTVHSTPAPTHTTPTTAAPAASTTTSGTTVFYTYGTLSVAVTGSRTHLTNVTIASINDGGNSLSASIDQYSIPILESEALSAQNANIQAVSGASYTSAGFAQSLQSALSKLPS